MSAYGLLFDQSKCIGCRACEQACQVTHGQRPHQATGLDRRTYNWVARTGSGNYMRHFCRHCRQPTCVSVCPVAALEKTADGSVIWNADRCLGCRYCVMACPFAVPKYEWDEPAPRVQKCDLCHERLARGEPTACASVCPTGATLFGRRDQLLAEAKRRLAAEPKTYRGGLYGEVEAGGTDVLLLLTEPAAAAGLPAGVPEAALPNLTWQVLNKIPVILPLWTAFLGGMYWLTERKNQIARGSDREE